VYDIPLFSSTHITHCSCCLTSNVRGDFWAKLVEILVFPISTVYMWTIFDFLYSIEEHSINSFESIGNSLEALILS
jgi:hypothetical protein